MESSPIQISHDRLVRVKPIEENHQQFTNDEQIRYFIYEIDDNRWQNVDPIGEIEEDLLTIKQEPALLPIGILAVDKKTGNFSFEGDLTVTKEDQMLILKAISR